MLGFATLEGEGRIGRCLEDERVLHVKLSCFDCCSTSVSRVHDVFAKYLGWMSFKGNWGWHSVLTGRRDRKQM